MLGIFLHRILMLLLVVSACGVAFAQSDWEVYRQQEEAYNRAEIEAAWKIKARSLISEADKIKRVAKSIRQSDEPAGASAKYNLAWKYMVRKAKEVILVCESLTQRAEMVEQGDMQSIEDLSKLILACNLACNELQEAQDDLKRTPYSESTSKEEPLTKPSPSSQKQQRPVLPKPRQKTMNVEHSP
jgi:hypothetical protein